MSVYEAQVPEHDLKSMEDSVNFVDEDVTKKRKDKESAQRERELGKSLLPFSRVQKIIKADKVGINGACSTGIASSGIPGTSNNRA